MIKPVLDKKGKLECIKLVWDSENNYSEDDDFEDDDFEDDDF
ncbi:MAG: hypothetical protein WDK95_06735 [Syntrophorhabdaceae bacterium]